MYFPLHRFLLFLILVLYQTVAYTSTAETIRIGVLKFGTVNWELDVMQQHRLAEREGVKLQIVPLASKSATHVAIQGGAVDVIVTDWVWVSRQRAEGRGYSFAPYSTAAGSLMVSPDANIATLEALAGKRLGVAGGPVDKSWLLLRAYGRKQTGKDLARITRPSFAAPPLLNELALRGELPAVLNFWHYSARLKAAGFRPLISVPQILRKLGISAPVPLVGWAFKEDWAAKHETALQGLLRASQAAKKILAESDQEWERLQPLLKAPDDRTGKALRDAYRAGITNCFDQSVIDAADKIFRILAAEGGRELVGQHKELSEGTFWTRLKFIPCRQ